MTQIIKTLYNFDLNIQYNNNFEYRNCLRQLFFMDYKLPDNLKDIDAETQDEYNYDEECISSTMSLLFSYTKDNMYFNELYDIIQNTFIIAPNGIKSTNALEINPIKIIAKINIKMHNIQSDCSLSVSGFLYFFQLRFTQSAGPGL